MAKEINIRKTPGKGDRQTRTTIGPALVLRCEYHGVL